MRAVSVLSASSTVARHPLPTGRVERLEGKLASLRANNADGKLGKRIAALETKLDRVRTTAKADAQFAQALDKADRAARTLAGELRVAKAVAEKVQTGEPDAAGNPQRKPLKTRLVSPHEKHRDAEVERLTRPFEALSRESERLSRHYAKTSERLTRLNDLSRRFDKLIESALRASAGRAPPAPGRVRR